MLLTIACPNDINSTDLDWSIQRFSHLMIPTIVDISLVVRLSAQEVCWYHYWYHANHTYLSPTLVSTPRCLRSLEIRMFYSIHCEVLPTKPNLSKHIHGINKGGSIRGMHFKCPWFTSNFLVINSTCTL